MTHDDDVYLGDMLRYGRRIPEYTREGRGRFFADRMVQDAVIRNFEVVGEAAAQVSPQFRNAQRSPGARSSGSGTYSSMDTRG